jgi:hypothetical protein
MSVGATDWRLVDADGNRLHCQRTMSDIFHAWPYPVRSTSLVTGLCATGYVMWAVPAGFQPTTVRLLSEGADGPIAEWTLT